MSIRILTAGVLSAAALAMPLAAAATPAQAATVHNFVAKTDINGRAHIGDSANAPGHKYNAYLKGHNVPVVCQQDHNGSLWDYTADKWWVPDEWVKTGYSGHAPGVPTCNATPAPKPAPTPAPAPTHSTAHGRSSGPAGPTTGTRQQKIDRIIAAARAQEGKGYQYSWGAGGKGGASYGIKELSPSGYNDYNRLGFDCSGLTLYAYWKGAGIDIGYNSNDQIKHGTMVDKKTSTHKVDVSKLEPGDLIFWGSSTSNTDHVAIYVGNGKVIQASPPRGANSIRETPIGDVEKGGPVAAVRVF